MEYSEILSQYIEKSGLKITQIQERLIAKGIQIDRSYISKLKTGAKPPASQEISIALAEVTGGDPEALLQSANMLKIPDEYLKLLQEIDIFLWDILDYLSMKCDALQLTELIKSIQLTNIRENFLRLLNIPKEDLFDAGSLANYLSIFATYGRLELYLSEKLDLAFTVLKFYKNYDDRLLEEFITEDDMTQNTIFGPLKIPIDSIKILISAGEKEHLTEDESEYLKESLKIYRRQKLKYFNK